MFNLELLYKLLRFEYKCESLLWGLTEERAMLKSWAALTSSIVVKLVELCRKG